jgi:hypothetical protein
MRGIESKAQDLYRLSAFACTGRAMFFIICRSFAGSRGTFEPRDVDLQDPHALYGKKADHR